MLNNNDEDQEQLFRILESNVSSDSLEDDFSSSSNSCYQSGDESSGSPTVKLGCRNSCCNVIKTVNVLTKSEENESLLIKLISQIENPKLQKEYLDKLKKNLTKDENVKKLKATISFEETLERFNKKKSKDLTVNEHQHEITVVKQEIIELKNEFKSIKSDDNNLKQELLLLRIDKHQSDNEQDELKDGDESSQQAFLSDKGIADALTDSQLNLGENYVAEKQTADINTTNKWIKDICTTNKWNIMTSSAERKNKGKAPAQGYPQDKRLPAGQPFVMHEGISSGVKPSRSISLQEFVPAEVYASHYANLFSENEAFKSHYVNLVSENEALKSHLVNHPIVTNERYTSQLFGKEEIHSMDKKTMMGTDYARLSLKTQSLLRSAVANLPTEIQFSILESKAMFRYTHQGQWYEGDSYLSFRDPYALVECWRSYFDNQILEVTLDLWKDYHFVGSTDMISVFGRRPYDIAIRNLRRIGHTDPREYLTSENPKYEPLLYCRLYNQYATYHEHGCNNDSPWDPYDSYPSDAPYTN
ncbi:hypothetical protein SO802_021395 [Lithocarpus litseifolius]|uniref:Uncharacterized protein n=1 Tax=Lithocarpus litseifolius TaxID=425828 RepID=A0AAW2CJ28_9ROSI